MKNDSKVVFNVVLPERSSDNVSEGLRSLTEAIFKQSKEVCCGFFGLGGEYGYGTYWDNDVFMMHPYCWCEEDDCPWCGVREAPNFWHKPTNFKVWWYKYIGRSMEIENPGNAEWDNILKDCLTNVNETNGAAVAQ